MSQTPLPGMKDVRVVANVETRYGFFTGVRRESQPEGEEQ